MKLESAECSIYSINQRDRCESAPFIDRCNGDPFMCSFTRKDVGKIVVFNESFFL